MRNFQRRRRIEASELARECAAAAADRKAADILIIDLRGLSSYTDYFVICSVASEPQLKAVAGSVQDALRERCGLKPKAVDGLPASQWVVVDYTDVIVHIFHHDLRLRYALEDLWNDAPVEEFVETSE